MNTLLAIGFITAGLVAWYGGRHIRSLLQQRAEQHDQELDRLNGWIHRERMQRGITARDLHHTTEDRDGWYTTCALWMRRAADFRAQRDRLAHKTKLLRKQVKRLRDTVDRRTTERDRARAVAYALTLRVQQLSKENERLASQAERDDLDQQTPNLTLVQGGGKPRGKNGRFVRKDATG